MFEIVALYWFENLVIGAVCILKIVFASGEVQRERGLSNPRKPRIGSKMVAKFILILFLTIHYGSFCIMHCNAVIGLLDEKDVVTGSGPISNAGGMISYVLGLQGRWFVIAIAASHLFSFAWYFMGMGEYRRTPADEAASAPYGRIIVLLFTILLGGMLVKAFGSPFFMLLILVAGKIILEARLQLRSQQNQNSKGIT